jgi:hypothetical protein
MICLAQSEQVRLDDLPPSIRGDYEAFVLPSIARDETLRAWASRYARLVWHRSGQNKRKACRALGISYHTLDAHLRYRPRVPHAPAQPEDDRRGGRATPAAAPREDTA